MSNKSGEKEKEGGPSIKQHTGRFVIGETNKDAHRRTEEENKKMESKLEQQYQVGLEKKLTGQNRRHVGLGFVEPEEEKEDKPSGTHIRFDDDDEVSKNSETSKGSPKEGGEDAGDQRRGDKDLHGKKERRDERQKRDEKRREGDAERRRSEEQVAERGFNREGQRSEARDGRASSRDEDRRHGDHGDRDNRERKEDRSRRDSQAQKEGQSGRNGDKHRRSEEAAGETTEQKRKKHKTWEEDSGSE
ncbi:small acidic protein-like isoform X2 [Acanthaster planci]|uniref:Small acidic protein n=1 Tax=Acanthaster planci TaxID=133434 RepID=A0A8B7Z5B8_ACAPL|nr:small acidic protein-like isoform X2 [Acanthaster planci]